MSDLTTKTSKVCCVINLPNRILNDISAKQQIYIEKSLSNINRYFTMLGIDNFAILHDLDSNPSTGEIKTKHIHLVLLALSRHQVSWYLKRVCEIMNFESLDEANLISIMPCDNSIGAIQYLTHKNDKDKYQYHVDSIVTNVSNDKLLSYLAINLESVELTFEYLEQLYIDCDFSQYKLMKTIGIGRYNAFRNTINDFLKVATPQLKNRLLKEGVASSIINED